MPKRTDIKSILIIGAGPIVIGQACEFDYSGVQACKALKAEGYRVILVNSNPATIMTDPDMADATYIEPITPEIVEKIIEKERPDALLPTMGGQTALNTALALDASGALEKYGVEMIGAKADVIDKAEDRQKFRDAMDKLGLESPKSKAAHTMDEALDGLEFVGLPAVIRPSFTLAGTGGGIAYNREEFEEIVAARAGPVADHRGADRGERARLEGVRDGGRPRQGGQLHHHLLDREHRPDGRAHGRLHHRRPRPDADRQRVPAHAHGLDQRAARDRRRDRRIERPVGHQSRRRPDGRDRDEPARVAVVGAGVQGHRLPHRQGRGASGRRLHAGRTDQRHHHGDAGLVRAVDRLCRDQDPALRLREISGLRAASGHLDEVGRRGHGHRPDLPGIDAEGPARAGDRPVGLRRDRDRGHRRRRGRRLGPRRRGAGAGAADARPHPRHRPGLPPRPVGRGGQRRLFLRAVVPAPDRRHRPHRGPRPCPGSADRPDRVPQAEVQGLLRRPSGAADRRDREGRPPRPSRPERAPRVQADRHLRRRVRQRHRLYVFDL